jgi:hypothetical protein
MLGVKRFKIVPVALLVACSGHVANTPPASGLGGAAGEVGAAGAPSGAGTQSADVAGQGGAAGSRAGGAGGVEDAAGAAGAGLSDGGAGGEGARACIELECLAGAELLYVPDRQWQRPAGSPSIMEELAEADYKSLAGPSWRAEFSGDARTIELTPVLGGATVHGTRDQKREDRAWFELGLFSGGRFVVQASPAGLHAEFTTYGSGTPIVDSTRGPLEAP